MQDEINLAAYISPLLRRWKWIAGVTVLGALMGALLVFTTPSVYEATATMTVIATGNNPFALSPGTQRQVLESNQIATQVVSSLGSVIEPGESAETLATRVRVINDPADRALFRITAQANTPKKAAAIANAWAEAGIQELIRLQTEDRGKQIQALQVQLQASAQDVENARKEWFAAEQKLAAKNLEAKRQAAQAAQQAAHIDLLKSQMDLLNRQLEPKERALEAHEALLRSNALALQQVISLKEAVQQGQDNLSLETLILMQLGVLRSPGSLILPSSGTTALSQSQKIERLNTINLILESDKKVITSNNLILESDKKVITSKIAALSDEIQLLQKKIAQTGDLVIESASTLESDIAKSNYLALVQELQRARASQLALPLVVRLANPAVPPTQYAQTKPTQTITIAAFIGLVASVLGVLALEYTPLRSRRA